MTVVLAARREEDARSAAAALGVEHVQLDVSGDESVAAAAAAMRERHGHLDVLVNNAGVALDGFDADVVRKTIDVNFFGPLRVTDAMRPLLSEEATVVMVSSGMGALSCLGSTRRKQLDDDALTRQQLVELVRQFVDDYEGEGWPRSAYRVSKVGLNALTRVLARELAPIRVNAVCPGWVRTDMGGRGASRSVEEGASGIVWAATRGPDGPTGGFFRDGSKIAW
jgi:carbonyl reductase 1